MNFAERNASIQKRYTTGKNDFVVTGKRQRGQITAQHRGRSLGNGNYHTAQYAR